MKKVVSISITLLMLTAMLHLSVATHYCGGTIAAAKISFSGKLASCGMENSTQDLTASGSRMVSHCCENILAFYGINSAFFPSFSFIPESYRDIFQVFSFPEQIAIQSLEPGKSIYTSVNPPGASFYSSVDLSDICVFRI